MEALRGICGALGVAPGPDQLAKLQTYLALLRRWNATYNLTAVRDPADILVQHVADCLAAAVALERSAAAPTGARILDVGSGGGLPGVLLALHRSDWQVTCADAAAKKSAFVRQVAGLLQLPNLASRHVRVEALRDEPFDLVTARAFASLADLVRLTDHALRPGGQWMAMKGQMPTAEMAALPPEIVVFHVEPLNVPGLNARRCLVWMRRRSDSREASAPLAGPAGRAGA
ncbi:MAG: 16S rRNA (guanine(527)-N(7))-methyltransferase RsmG [Rubrivivax sp.]|nr:16S rRNA (guanine(527)-N(7))-methyltransferase RsmG [Rubrivivax sp.]